MSLKQVYRQVSKFKYDQEKLKDEQRPGAPRTASADAIKAKITNINTYDGILTIKQIETLVGISSGTVFSILY